MEERAGVRRSVLEKINRCYQAPLTPALSPGGGEGEEAGFIGDFAWSTSPRPSPPVAERGEKGRFAIKTSQLFRAVSKIL